MEDNIKKVEEEIRQYKLFKIQTTENKIRDYEVLYAIIKENIVIKFTKNSFSNIIRLALILISIGLIILSIILIFPEFAISIMENNGKVLSQAGRNKMIEIFPYLGYFILGLGLLLSSISYLLKKNNHKRSIIYKLSNLLDEIIKYMKENVKEEKKKYEYFVDSIAEIEAISNNNSNSDNKNATQQKI